MKTGTMGTRQPRTEVQPGIVVVDKPQGWTSHDVVGRMRRLAHTKKVGHAGTLDPMATGVLVIGIGKATKLLTYIVGHRKTYQATIRLGQATVTDDAEGDITQRADAGVVSDADLAAASAALTGEIMQRPSSVSAIKVDGQRAYKRVRDGEDVKLAARPVTVHAFEVLAVRRGNQVMDVDVRVEVSSGTYVRALARDLGDALSVGGHLTALRRTTVGEFTLEDAHTLDDLAALVDAGGEVPRVPMATAASAILPAVTLTEAQQRALGYGQAIEADAHQGRRAGGAVAAIGTDGTLIAIVELKGQLLAPVVVFEPAGAASQSTPGQ